MLSLIRSRIVQFAKGFALAGLVALGACGGGGSSTPTLQSIEITPAAPSVAAGTSIDLKATAIYSDGTHPDVTTQVTWASSDTSVASIPSNTGRAVGSMVGSVTITATMDGKTASTTLNVTAATLLSIAVTPPTPSIALGTTQQLTATGTFTDNSHQDLSAQVAWTSSDTNVATVGTAGLATSAAVGSTNLTAALGGVSSAPVALTVTAATLVSIDVTPATPSIALGTTQQFAATGTYTDNSHQDLTTQVGWASSDAAVASIDAATGLATSVTQGSTNITATLNGVSSTPVPLAVTPAALVRIDLTPAAATSIALGATQQFQATGIYTDNSNQNLTTQVTWASSDAGVATISNAAGSNGRATSAAVGSTNITAALQGVTSSAVPLTVTQATLVSIAVTPANASIPLGNTQQYVATGTYSDASTQVLTTQVTWASSAPAKATISNANGTKGLATSVATGSTNISASLGGVTSPAKPLTVTPAALVSIAVVPQSASIAKGTTQQYAATGTYTDASTQNLTTQVTWASSDAAKASISNAGGSNGLATALATGSTNITAALGGVTSPAVTLTVTPATLVSIAVTPATPRIAAGATQQFTATGTYTDASTQNLTTQVTWASTDTAKATISNVDGSRGLATSLAAGTTSITATSGSVVSPAVTLTVTAASYTYLVNSADNTVSQYAVGTDGVLAPLSPATLSTGINPQGIAVSPNGLYVYVANYGVDADALAIPPVAEVPGSISIYSIGLDGKLTAVGSPVALPAGRHTRGVVVHPSGNYVYVTGRGDGTNGNKVFQFTGGNNGTLTPMGTDSVDTDGKPSALALDATGANLYVANFSGETVTHYTVDSGTGALTWQVADTVATGVKPTAIVVSGTNMFVTNFCEGCGTNDISQYTIGAGGVPTPKTPATVAANTSRPYNIAVTPNGQYAYVAATDGDVGAPNSGEVSQYTVDGTTGVLGAPSSSNLINRAATVAVDPSGKFVYVASYTDSEVSMFSIGANGALTSLGAPVAAGLNSNAMVTVAAH